MKKLVILIAAMTLITSTAVSQEDDFPTVEVVLGLSSVYVPSGFDADTEAFVVVNGLYPNTCYNFNRAEVIHKSATQHEVTAIANVKQGICIRVFVPFTQEVELGRLAQGDHTVRFVFGDGTHMEKTLTVE